MDLEQFFRQKIAERDGVPVGVVTLRYIGKKTREIEMDAKYETPSNPHLRVLTRRELEALAEF